MYTPNYAWDVTMKISSDSETLQCNTSDIKFHFAKVLYIQIKIKFCTMSIHIYEGWHRISSCTWYTSKPSYYIYNI